MSKDDPDADLRAEDEVIEKIVERALAPWAKFMSPAQLAFMRAELAEVWQTHPVTAKLLEQLRPAPIVDESGTIAAKPVTEADPKKAGGGGA
jgi:hypothetical protein